MTQSTEKKLLKTVIQINNKVQDVNQKIILLAEDVDKKISVLTDKVDEGFAKNEEAHEELKELILRGDHGAANLIVDEEDERNTLLRRIVVIEKDVKKIKQHVFA